MKKLGRGLDSLIEETRTDSGGPTGEVETMLVRPNPFQPREEMRSEELEELVSSIRTHGVLQPILVRPVEGGYEVVAGERRLRAALAAGLAKIPATVRDIADSQMLELALVENLQREDLNPIEKARAYRRYVDGLGLTHEAAAQRLGKDRTSITNQIRLLELSSTVQEMVSRGTLSMGHARALLGLASPEARSDLAQRIERDGLSVREAERLVREASDRPPPPPPTPPPAKSAYFEDLERRLRERFATKARIDGGKEKGRILIEYYSMDELSRLLEALLGEPL
ncbi:MAG: ParB/RepB/Spo0J family partition protein [Planctomycetes bacterium]|jgi:ParB family chromosome partitioning protein|nr:ParB/RepB/Spo0J family partition protein [Planctomycetota bacterium]